MRRLMVVVALVCAAALAAACANDQNNQTDDDDLCDISDDDAASDDDADDDTAATHPPRITNAYFYPETMDYVDAQWHSVLFVVVCDLGNDLTPDGQVCFDDAVAKATTCEDWRDWAVEPGDDIAQAGDCGSPVVAYRDFWFGDDDPPPPFSYCVTVDGTDNAGNRAKTYGPVCVVWDPV